MLTGVWPECQAVDTQSVWRILSRNWDISEDLQQFFWGLKIYTGLQSQSRLSELYKANSQVLPVRRSSSSVLAQLVTPLSPDVLSLILLLYIVSQRSRGQTMRWIFCIHFTALLVCRLEACHHKHKTNKLGQPSASSNNNNVRTNLNTIGRRKRQTYNNVGSVGRNPTVTNTSPGLRNTRTGSDDGLGLEPWSKLYWPLW